MKLLSGVVGQEITLAEVAAALASGEREFIVCSNGGDIFQGLAIADLFASTGGVTCRVLGVAASAASVLCMGAEKIEMADSSMMMIHLPWMGVEGNASDMEGAAATLRQIESRMVALYARRMASKTPEDIAAMLKAETWISATEAQALGLCDNLASVEQVSAMINQPKKESKPVSILAKIRAFVNAMEDEKKEDDPAPAVPPVKEEEPKAMNPEQEALQVERDALAAKIAELDAKLAEMASKSSEDEEEAEAKTQAAAEVVEALANGKLTLIDAKRAISAKATEARAILAAAKPINAAPIEPAKIEGSKSAIYAQLSGVEAQKYFAAHKAEILRERGK